MREDPIISGGIFKLILVVLVTGALGAGAWALTGGVDIDLPDLPEIDTGEGVTTLSEGDFSDTTIGGDAPEPPPPAAAGSDPFTTAGFASALAAVREEAGPGRQLTRLFINEVQTQLVVRTGGEGVEAWSVRADTGELTRSDATVTISGNATIDDFAFALDAVKAGAVDRMLAQARKASGALDFRPTVLSLERGIPFGERELRWTINAQGNARNLLYRAVADGRNLTNVGGEGSPIPPAAIEAQKLNDCIRDAQSDPEAIFECLEKFN